MNVLEEIEEPLGYAGECGSCATALLEADSTGGLQADVLPLESSAEETPLVATVRRAQAGDREALGELMERYERAVYAIALRRLNNHAEAQELCQEVFVQALEKLAQLREPAAFGGWLRSIANRMAINRAIRRGPRLSAEPESLEASCVEHRTPLGNVLASEAESQVRAGLDRLGALDRQTLVAFYMNGRSLVQMSDDFASPVGTIKRRLHVARKRLAQELAEMGP
ncbi:MAG TPA: sigma-70 family RNA polymerase sigma factor [Pirellulales bacterium]|jgi:RNA polymerase sigma-70 factor (ECF subfamily)|nr:sigma-70 family RNA polymerase sigma factor [Pirellulales bacterium]